jgi:hypothetical protein
LVRDRVLRAKAAGQMPQAPAMLQGHPYVYAENNPANRIDPSGLQSCQHGPSCQQHRASCPAHGYTAAAKGPVPKGAGAGMGTTGPSSSAADTGPWPSGWGGTRVDTPYVGGSGAGGSASGFATSGAAAKAGSYGMFQPRGLPDFPIGGYWQGRGNWSPAPPPPASTCVYTPNPVGDFYLIYMCAVLGQPPRYTVRLKGCENTQQCADRDPGKRKCTVVFEMKSGKVHKQPGSCHTSWVGLPSPTAPGPSRAPAPPQPSIGPAPQPTSRCDLPSNANDCYTCQDYLSCVACGNTLRKRNQLSGYLEYSLGVYCSSLSGEGEEAPHLREGVIPESPIGQPPGWPPEKEL